jgi:hypothetical protein
VDEVPGYYKVLSALSEVDKTVEAKKSKSFEDLVNTEEKAEEEKEKLRWKEIEARNRAEAVLEEKWIDGFLIDKGALVNRLAYLETLNNENALALYASAKRRAWKSVELRLVDDIRKCEIRDKSERFRKKPIWELIPKLMDEKIIYPQKSVERNEVPNNKFHPITETFSWHYFTGILSDEFSHFPRSITRVYYGLLTAKMSLTGAWTSSHFLPTFSLLPFEYQWSFLGKKQSAERLKR